MKHQELTNIFYIFQCQLLDELAFSVIKDALEE